MNLDTNDPYLRRNLNRLEARFKARYYSSVQKDARRKKMGKPPHQGILQSIEENRERLERVKQIRAALFPNTPENARQKPVGE